MTAPAVAPYLGTYSARQPYLTVDEYTSAPTSVDLDDLVDGGGQQEQKAMLATIISRASSMADDYCHQVLGASVDTQVGEYGVRGGHIRVAVAYTPLIAVTAVAMGWRSGALQELTDLSGLWIKRKTVQIPVSGLTFATPQVAPGVQRSGRIYAQVTYVNGYPNTTLAEDAEQGAETVEVTDPTGLYPGSVVRIYDPVNGTDEMVSVAARTGSSVTLADPLVNAHAEGVAVSALPPSVKQAVVMLTTALIATRGDDAIVMNQLNSPGAMRPTSGGSDDQVGMAQALLAPYKATGYGQ